LPVAHSPAGEHSLITNIFNLTTPAYYVRLAIMMAEDAKTCKRGKIKTAL
jgi:hypothetical protein